jgi:hypothetical protein
MPRKAKRQLNGKANPGSGSAMSTVTTAYINDKAQNRLSKPVAA